MFFKLFVYILAPIFSTKAYAIVKGSAPLTSLLLPFCASITVFDIRSTTELTCYYIIYSIYILLTVYIVVDILVLRLVF